MGERRGEQSARADSLSAGLPVLLKRHLPGLRGEPKLERLPGDASNRQYYRVQADEKRFILMRVMDDSPAKVFEEKTELKKVDELPFVNVHRFLSAIAVPVPKIHVWDPGFGLMLLEDWGDLMLEGVVQTGDWARIRPLYEKCLDAMVRLQVEGTRQIGEGTIAYHQRFNVPLLVWEFDHFLEYGVDVRGGREMEPADRKQVRAVFQKLAEEIEGQPRVLTHRDFHSRNVMVLPGDEIGLIDFQDALMGPVTYDLASLLRDAYVTLPEEMVDSLVEGFLSRREKAGAERLDHQTFRRMFDVCSIQRNLKAAGRFVFIEKKKGNPKFLKHIPPVLAYVKRNLAKYPELVPALEALRKYVPELA